MSIKVSNGVMSRWYNVTTSQSSCLAVWIAEQRRRRLPDKDRRVYRGHANTSVLCTRLGTAGMKKKCARFNCTERYSQNRILLQYQILVLNNILNNTRLLSYRSTCVRTKGVACFTCHLQYGINLLHGSVLLIEVCSAHPQTKLLQRGKELCGSIHFQVLWIVRGSKK